MSDCAKSGCKETRIVSVCKQCGRVICEYQGLDPLREKALDDALGRIKELEGKIRKYQEKQT